MLSHRSHEKELLDLGPDHYTPAEFDHCQKMLFRVNKIFGCFNDTVKTLHSLRNITSIMDVGCGGGLFLLHLGRHFPHMRLSGVDISKEAIHHAEHEKKSFGYATANVSFHLLSEPALTYPENHVDVILATMVCHHMSDDEIIIFLQQALHSSRRHIIINDLHRHPIAYWFYRFLSPVLFQNRLITHDGLISIKRSFIRADWERLVNKAGIKHYQIKWCFPFRWRIMIWKTS